MGLVKFRMEKCRFLYNSMDLCSFGLERLDTWFGTFSLCMVLVWKLSNSFLVRVELRKVVRLL